jgi:hypothetical protein
MLSLPTDASESACELTFEAAEKDICEPTWSVFMGGSADLSPNAADLAD